MFCDDVTRAISCTWPTREALESGCCSLIYPQYTVILPFDNYFKFSYIDLILLFFSEENLWKKLILLLN